MIIKLSETYDLSTAVGKMGLVSIRSPNLNYIEKKYPGFVRNFKFVRVVSGNVKISCASMLPADPLQIGVTAGKIAPADAFNPLLYKAVSNESWEGLVNRMYATANVFTSLSDSVKYSSGGDAFPLASSEDSTRAYYALLSDPSFKKAHPQAGLNMTGLKPLVFPLLHTLGQPSSGVAQTSAPGSDAIGLAGAGDVATVIQLAGSYMKGSPVPMPRVPTASSGYSGSDGSVGINKGYLPICYCAVIITPPSELNLLYYRLVCEWYVEFSVPRSDMQLATMGGAAELGRWSRTQTYGTPPSLSSVSSTAVADGSVDADGIELQKVMES